MRVSVRVIIRIASEDFSKILRGYLKIIRI